MICSNCKTESPHIWMKAGLMRCSNCGNFGVTSGKTGNLLTQNATRITDQQIQYEGDMITPYMVDKSTKQVVVNQDFIDLYPEQAAQTYSEQELKNVGQEGLKIATQPEHENDIEFKGNEEDKIKEILS